MKTRCTRLLPLCWDSAGSGVALLRDVGCIQASPTVFQPLSTGDYSSWIVLVASGTQELKPGDPSTCQAFTKACHMLKCKANKERRALQGRICLLNEIFGGVIRSESVHRNTRIFIVHSAPFRFLQYRNFATHIYV